MSLKGRPLPTANVGFPVAHAERQLPDDDIARPTGAGRPGDDIQQPEPPSGLLPVGRVGVQSAEQQQARQTR
jgi:hypothetical protein